MLERAGMLYRFVVSFPAFVRLAQRLILWNIPSGRSIEERAARLPGGAEEYARIEEYIFLPPKLYQSIRSLEALITSPQSVQPSARDLIASTRNSVRVAYGLKRI